MQKMDRKDFFKKACLAGVCFCGFSNIPGMANDNASTVQEPNLQLNQDWLSALISNLNQEIEEDQLRRIIKKSSATHFNDLNMSTLLSDYIGDLEKFIKYLESSWGWKVSYNKTTGTIIADENKDSCVCPVLEHRKGLDTSAICYCSEGFAEKMFSVVTGVPVKARVISSIRRGGKSCRYKIDLL